MKLFIATVAVLAVIVGCNTTKRSNEVTAVSETIETIAQSRKTELLMDSLFQKAIIVLDSVEIELSQCEPNKTKLSKTLIKSRQITIDASKDKRSVALKIDTTTATANQITQTSTHSKHEMTNKSSIYDVMIIILIALAAISYLWLMRKK